MCFCPHFWFFVFLLEIAVNRIFCLYNSIHKIGKQKQKKKEESVYNVLIGCTHLEVRDENERIRQFDWFYNELSKLTNLENMPVIIAGDFNALSHSDYNKVI